jgi:RNA polymerase sigma-70 factor (ECF subfamily)
LSARLSDLIRRYLGAKRRDVRLERELGGELEESSRVLDQGLVAPHSSPNQQAARREQAVLLADALERLPEDYREIIILRQMEGLSFQDVGCRMGKTVRSVEKLWMRALARLRRVLGGDS